MFKRKIMLKKQSRLKDIINNHYLKQRELGCSNSNSNEALDVEGRSTWMPVSRRHKLVSYRCLRRPIKALNPTSHQPLLAADIRFDAFSEAGRPPLRLGHLARLTRAWMRRRPYAWRLRDRFSRLLKHWSR